MKLLDQLPCFPDLTLERNYFSITTFKEDGPVIYSFDGTTIGSITRYDQCYKCHYSSIELYIIFNDDSIKIRRQKERKEYKIFFFKEITIDQVMKLVKYNLTSWDLIQSCLNLVKIPLNIIKYDSINYSFKNEKKVILKNHDKKIGRISEELNVYHVEFPDSDIFITIEVNKFVGVYIIRRTSEFDLIEEEFNFRIVNINIEILIKLALSQDFSISNIKKVLSL